MSIDKRYYTRYHISADCIIGLERGITYPAEVLDLSAEGAKLRTYQEVDLRVGDYINIVVKAKHKFKAKAEIRWITKDSLATTFGVKFVEMSMQDKEVLSELLSEIALSGLSDYYL